MSSESMMEQFKKWHAQGVVTPLMQVEAGKMYKVLCISAFPQHVADEINKGVMMWMPVVPFAHEDHFPSLGWIPKHYHYDTRFMSAKELDWCSADDYRTGSVSRPLLGEWGHNTPVEKVMLRKCRTAIAGGMPLPMGQLTQFEQSHYGKSCKGKKCPHWGMPMVERANGVLECPLHGLFGDAATERIISRIEAVERMES